jgi:hypothetical protein
MTTTKRGPSQCSSGRCCRGDHIGDFTETNIIPGTNNARQYEYQPTDNACRYQPISRGQILHYLHSRGSPLVVIGDSMMRQFFLRLVMMMRGQQRLLDYHLHAHAQYAVCHEADAFRISTSSSNISGVAPNNAYLQAKAPSFFRMGNGPGRYAGRNELLRCSRKPTEFHYMHAPKWKDQASMLPAYFDSLAAGVKPVLLTSVGYWEGRATIPDEYLDALDALKDRTRKVFVVSVPTVRVPTEERKQLLRERNIFMKNWVEQRGEPYAFLDFDALSIAAHAPPGGSEYNWHYMCSVVWRIACAACDLVQIDHSDGFNSTTGERITPPQILQGNIERIHATEDGMCVDEMNRNLWQVVFNVLLKPSDNNNSGNSGGNGGDNNRSRWWSSLAG